MTRMIPLSVLLAVIAVSAHPLQAQDLTRAQGVRESVYLEAGGPAGVASINYDRLLSDRWAVRIGVEPDGSGPHISEWFPEIPITASYLGLDGRHRIEAGGGIVVTAGSPHDEAAVTSDYTVHVGYRYQPTGSGLFFRATLLNRRDHPSLHWPESVGVGLGYAF